MKRNILIISLTLAVIVGFAGAASEGVYTADTAVRLIPGSETGPSTIDAWSVGTGSVQFFWKDYDENPATVLKTSPNYALRAGFSRHFQFSGGPDSMYVDYTADEIIVSW